MKQSRIAVLRLIVWAIFLMPVTTSCNNKAPQKDIQQEKPVAILSRQPTPEDIASDALAYTVAITVQDKDHQTLGLGSGFVVANGKVITNRHVIEGARYATVSLRKEKYNVDGYLAIDDKNDLALLSVPLLPQRVKPIEIDTSMPKVGSKIFSVGNPHGLEGTFAEGNISAIREFEERELIQITAPISPGSSGGPIINDKGALIGIAVGGIIEGQNLNFSIPSKNVKRLLDEERKVTILNIPKKESSSKKIVETDIKNAVIVRKLLWFMQSSDIAPIAIQDGSANHLVEFSILNQLNYPVYNVSLFFILYDSGGVPVDYDGLEVASSESEAILPGLARVFSPRPYLSLDKKAGYRCEVRVLDFSVLKE